MGAMVVTEKSRALGSEIRTETLSTNRERPPALPAGSQPTGPAVPPSAV